MGKSKKSGFVNPMDKIRKDSRRRELKKNKKQRELAKATLMKIRDPYEIISALDRLDRVEFDPYNEPVFTEKVLETKRAKLMGSWAKLMAFHKKEDKERYEELKRIENNYNDRRDAIMREYKAIRCTESVDLDEIPLPSAPPPMPSMESSFSNPFLNANFKMPINRKPPGCPQGLPPRLDELDIDDVESSEDEGIEEKKNENNLTEFLKEIEMISGEKDGDKEQDGDNDGEKDDNNEDNVEENQDEKKNDDEGTDPVISSLPPIQAAPPILTVNPTPDIKIESSIPTLSLPINPAPPIPIPLLQPLSTAPQLRPMQPGIAPIRHSHPFRPNIQRHPFHHPQQIPLPSHSNYNREQKPKPTETKTTTIEAKPQLRNLAQDSTRFMPSQLRNKVKQNSQIKKPFTQPISSIPVIPKPAPASATPTKEGSKDAAYEEFMKEMQGFM